MKSIAWMNSKYAKLPYRNPKGYFKCLLECLASGMDFEAEEFVPGQDGSKEIYASPDGRYKVFMDKHKYVMLCEAGEG